MYIDRRINNSTWGGSARMCTSRAPLSWPFERNRLEAETTCVPLDVATIQTDLRRESSESSIAEVRRRSSNRQLRERRKNRTSHSLFLLLRLMAGRVLWTSNLEVSRRPPVEQSIVCLLRDFQRSLASSRCAPRLFSFSRIAWKKRKRNLSRTQAFPGNNYRGTVSKFVIALSKLVVSFFFF